MNVDRKVYRAAGGDLTADRSIGAFVFLAAGQPVSPADLKKYPVLGEFIPEIREKKAKGVEAEKPAYKEPEKAAERPADKRITQPQNKRSK